MDVLCVRGIDKGTLDSKGKNPASEKDAIFNGEIYTVVGNYNKDGFPCYFLAERRKTAAYNVLCFIPISDIDEVNIFENRKNDFEYAK